MKAEKDGNRAKIVSDFIQRKQEAAQNKARFLAQYHQPVRPAKNRDEENVKRSLSHSPEKNKDQQV